MKKHHGLHDAKFLAILRKFVRRFLYFLSLGERLMIRFSEIRMRYMAPLFIAVCTAVTLALVTFLFYLYSVAKESIPATLTQIELAMVLFLGFMLCVALVTWAVWWVVAYYRDVKALQDGLAKFKEDDFSSRLSGSASREFASLAVAYNDAAEYLGVQCMRRVDMHSIIESVAGLALITDTDDRILFSNSAARELLGRSEEELRDRSVWDYVILEERSLGDGDVEIISESTTEADASVPQMVEAQLMTAGGHIPVRLSIGTVNVEEEEPTSRIYFSHETRESTRLVGELSARADALQRYRDGLISVLEDSEMARRSLEDANREIQRVSQFKSQFLANMSHELRTPLNNIIGFTDLTMSDKKIPVDKKHQQYLERVMANSRELLDLINRVLDVTTFETGQIRMLRETFPLSSVVDSTFASVKNLMRGKYITLERDIAERLPLFKTDRVKLHSVIKNLLSNAIKFTEKGEVRLIAGPHPENQGWARIQVKDTGIGINKEDQQLIFEEFRQVDPTSTRLYGGSGLGLSIVKKFAKLLCGDVAVASKEGEGSVFTLDIPIELPSSLEPESTEEAL